MFKADKVVWKDGMFIYPQHFQQQDAYHEAMLQGHFTSQPYYNWGILELEIDESYLKLNKIVLKRCIGVLPNGVFFNVPTRDNTPEAIEIPSDYNNELVYLGIPMNEGCSLRASTTRKDTLTKYLPEEREVADLNSENSEDKIITVGKLNLSLFLKDEYSDQVVFLPILKVLNASNGVVLDSNYVPPCLRSSSSGILKSYAADVLGMLEHYINASRHLMGEGISNQDINRVENSLALQAVSKYRYLFKLISEDLILTPYELMQNIASLIGALVIFTKRHSLELKDLRYAHNNIAGSFAPLMNSLSLIFDELNAYITTQVVLNPYKDNIYIADLSDLVSLSYLDFIVGIEFRDTDSQPEHSSIFHSIKVASSTEIERIVSLQVSGAGFNVVNVVPSYVPYSENTLYLKLNQNGNFWKQIEEKKDMAVYLNIDPRKLASVKLWIMPNNQKA